MKVVLTEEWVHIPDNGKSSPLILTHDHSSVDF